MSVDPRVEAAARDLYARFVGDDWDTRGAWFRVRYMEIATAALAAADAVEAPIARRLAQSLRELHTQAMTVRLAATPEAFVASGVSVADFVAARQNADIALAEYEGRAAP